MNKITFTLSIPFILFAQPNWLYNIQANNNQIIGYGMNNSLSQAKNEAMSDIVKSISVSIESSTDISKKLLDNKYTKYIATTTKTKAQAILTGVEFTNVEQLDGLWYVSAKYDNAPLEIKFKKLLVKNLVSQKQNIYLKNTPLFKLLNKEISTNLNYQIIRKDNIWQIKYRDILLSLNQNNFYKLFTNHSDNKISLQANKRIYEENNDMYFTIKHKREAYISILYVEHNGKVGVLLSNKKSHKSFTYPDLRNEDTFKIANPYNKAIQELYVALYSENKIDLSDFENVSDSLLDASNYNFDKLISKFEKVNYSTFIIKIRNNIRINQ